MSSKFFTGKQELKTNSKTIGKNISGGNPNVKKNTGIRKTGRGK